jgi:hypothetical protein
LTIGLRLRHGSEARRKLAQFHNARPARRATG